VEDAFRSASLVAMNLILIAVVMIFAERHLAKVKDPTQIKDVSTKQATVVGLAQAIAVIPGFSRSGSTISAGLFMGMDRIAAMRFSFLLGIPITAGAIATTVLSGKGLDQIQHQPGVFAAGIIAALVSGLFAIKFLLQYLSKHSLNIFAYYRIGVGILVLLIALF
jgi:undecaprenyl-diphosphatase